VLTVSVEFPEAPAIDDGLNVHVGGDTVAADPFNKMLLQDSVTT
jgi:hypothetical protein